MTQNTQKTTVRARSDLQ